ncbi:hypothetical protein EC991_003910 [Linnemannia zychae]|nr:hypothetical protein EC991_003910 [Linnemannia zychae]
MNRTFVVLFALVAICLSMTAAAPQPHLYPRAILVSRGFDAAQCIHDNWSTTKDFVQQYLSATTDAQKQAAASVFQGDSLKSKPTVDDIRSAIANIRAEDVAIVTSALKC